MILVTPPEGFVPPPVSSSQSSVESAVDDSGLSGMADFDDIQSAIDDAIGKTTAPKIITGKKGPSAPGGSPTTLPQGRAAVNSAFIAAETARRRAGAATETGQLEQTADLSSAARGDWSSQLTRNRRKKLLAGLITVLVVAVAVSIFFALQGGGGPDSASVAKVENSENVPAGQGKTPDETGIIPDDLNFSTDPDNQPDRPADKNEPVDPAAQNPNSQPSTAPPTEIRQDPAVTGSEGPAPIPGLNLPVQPPVTTDQQPAGTTLPDSPLQQPPTIPDDPLKRNFGTGIQSGLAADVTSIPDALGELGALLQQHGTTLTEVARTDASSQADSFAGVPAFYITRPDAIPPPDVTAAMEIVAAKIVYTSVPLTRVLRELSQLGGIPVAWDIRAILDAGIDPQTPVDVNVVNGTLADALNVAAKKAGLELLPFPWGLGLIPEGDRQTITKTVSLIRTGTTDPERTRKLAAEIPNLVAPGTWEQPDSGFGVKVDGDQLEITHNQRTVRQVELVLEKLNLLAQKPDSDIPTAASSAEETLNRKIELAPAFDKTLEDFLVRIEKQPGITVLVDWSTISASGWNLNTVVPGNFSADDNRQLMKRMARSMDLDWYPVGPSTFVLTTRPAAAATIQAEIYPVERLVSRGFTPENLMELFRQTAGSGLPAGVFTNVYFDGDTKAFLVSAPPFVQEKVEAVVTKLKNTVQAGGGALPENPLGKCP